MLAGNKDNHKSLDGFELTIEPNSDCGVEIPFSIIKHLHRLTIGDLL